MQRLLVAACAFALVMTLTVRADEAKDKEKKKAESPKDIFQELVKKYQATEDEDEQAKLFTTYGQKLVDFAKANSKEDSAFEALSFVMNIPASPGKGTPKEQAIAILTKEYAKGDKIAPLVGNLSASDDATTGLLVTIFTGNPDKKIQGTACVKLIEGKENTLATVMRLKSDDKARATYDKSFGKGAAKKVIDDLETTKKDMAAYVKTLRADYKDSAKGLFIGDKMPELTSENLEGDKVKLSDIKDKVVVLDMWATWCPPCRAMIPHERELVKRLEKKPFALVSVSFDDKKETLTKFIDKNPMPWTHWHDGRTGMIAEKLSIRSFPTIYVLDHKGVIRFKSVRGKAMDAAVESLLAELEDEKKAKTE